MIASKFLGRMNVKLDPAFDLGDTPEGRRLIINAVGGTFEGPRIWASIQHNGGDWARIRTDGSGAVDVRGLMQTADGASIYLRFEGRFLIPPHLFNDALNPGEGDLVDPAKYYFRTTTYFETSSPSYSWLNSVVTVGIGQFGRKEVSYDLFEVE